MVIVETPGIGQGDAAIVDHVDTSLYVMTPEFGAASQLEKIDMLDFADVVAINKFERRGAADAMRDVARAARAQPGGVRQRAGGYAGIRHQRGDLQRRRGHGALSASARRGLPSRGCSSSPGCCRAWTLAPPHGSRDHSARAGAVSGGDRRDGARLSRRYGTGSRCRTRVSASSWCWTSDRAPHPPRRPAGRPFACRHASAGIRLDPADAGMTIRRRGDRRTHRRRETARAPEPSWHRKMLRYWQTGRRWPSPTAATSRSCGSGTRRSTPPCAGHPCRAARFPASRCRATTDHGELLRFLRAENLPGQFPFTAGVFPFKRDDEDPARMFAGEGDAVPHQPPIQGAGGGMPAKRLSTAFDSVTLYGHDPAERPDIYGKVGNSGVSIATLDDMKALYDGFDLTAPDHLGVDDDQRAGADDPRVVPEHRDRSGARNGSVGGRRARAHPGRGRRDPRLDAPRCAAPSRPTSSRRTRARTPASSPPSSACG